MKKLILSLLYGFSYINALEIDLIKGKNVELKVYTLNKKIKIKKSINIPTEYFNNSDLIICVPQGTPNEIKINGEILNKKNICMIYKNTNNTGSRKSEQLKDVYEKEVGNYVAMQVSGRGKDVDEVETISLNNKQYKFLKFKFLKKANYKIYINEHLVLNNEPYKINISNYKKGKYYIQIYKNNSKNFEYEYMLEIKK